KGGGSSGKLDCPPHGMQMTGTALWSHMLFKSTTDVAVAIILRMVWLVVECTGAMPPGDKRRPDSSCRCNCIAFIRRSRIVPGPGWAAVCATVLLVNVVTLRAHVGLALHTCKQGTGG
ncbi:hypothetical protein V8C86DRAFT_2459079, partial [Haematococcus lacustris]